MANAAAKKTETEHRLEEAKALLRAKSIGETDEAAIEQAIADAQQAAADDEIAEREFDVASDSFAQIQIVEKRWEHFDKWYQDGIAKWKGSQEYSLTEGEHCMDKMDLKNFLQSPQNKWTFANKQYTPNDLDDLFESMDANGDGVISHKEFMDFFLKDIIPN